MDCPEVVSRLWEYLDDELAAEEARAMRVHLESCPHCRPACCCDRAFLARLRACLLAHGSAPRSLVVTIRARLGLLP